MVYGTDVNINSTGGNMNLNQNVTESLEPDLMDFEEPEKKEEESMNIVIPYS